jgi:UrcA family protein
MTKYFNAHALGLSLVAATLVASAEPASARSDESSISVRVSFADLDINHPAGADKLLKRIERAADTVCGGEPSDPLLVESLDYRHCRGDAIRKAVIQANAPMLTALASRNIKPMFVASH